jgi:AcrR family transcriptional regulator
MTSEPGVKLKARRGRPPASAEGAPSLGERIAATAEALFRAHGYRAVSMRKLAAEVGCTAMAIYSYYPSKFRLLQHLWTLAFDELHARLAAAAGASDPRLDLQNLAAAFVEYWVANPENYRMVFMTEGVNQGEVVEFMADPGLARALAPLMAAALAALPAGEVERKLPLLIAALIGVAHCRVTMSAFPWGDEQRMARDLAAQLCQPAGGEDF